MISRLLMVVLGALLAFVMFCFLFWYGVLSSVEVVFYRGIAIALFAVVIELALFLFMGLIVGDARGQLFSLNDLTAMVSLGFAFNIVFLVLIPVTVDRSVSVFLLGHMSIAGKDVYTKEELETALIEKYVKEYEAVTRRMNEQILSRNIESKDGGFALTSQGEAFIEFSRAMARIFPIDTRFISAPVGQVEASK